MIYLIVFFIQGIIFGGFCAYLAKQKGRDGVSWFFIGAIFGLIGFIAIIATPKIEPTAQTVKADRSQKQYGNATQRVGVVALLLFLLFMFIMAIMRSH